MPESFKTRLLRWGFNFFPVYRRTGGRITHISNDFTDVRIKLPLTWKTRNYVGTMFGGSMYAAVDPLYMIMFIKLLGPDYIVWDKAASIRFKRPGRSTLFAKCLVETEELESIRRELVGSDKLERNYQVDLIDEEGTICASIEKTLYFRKKKRTRRVEVRLMRRICVFCGSSPGGRPEYTQAAEKLGRVLLEREIGLVYGGANVGLMGKLAETVFAGGGDVIGVIPSGLVKMEVAFEQLPDLRVVDSMHERKAMMADLADGFIAMPGGLGTIEEIFEVLTWAQLGFHDKPCGFLNICSYYKHLITFLETAVGEKFIRADHQSMVLVDERPEALLDQFDRYQSPKVDKAKWILSLKNR